jgi:transposase
VIRVRDVGQAKEEAVEQVRLGIDVACVAKHQASLADEAGRFLWQGWRFRTDPAELEALWAKIPDGAAVQVVMEPTRNAWVPLAAWLQAKGAAVSVVPPEQSADLRDYYSKHAKTDRLDSRMLACMPMHHPKGLRTIDDLGPAVPLKRAVRHRDSILKRRQACAGRVDGLLELMGPHWVGIFGEASYNKTAVVVLEKYANPYALRKLGRSRLIKLMIRSSRGHIRDAKADELLEAVDLTLQLWTDGGLDFDELAADIEIEIAQVRLFDDQIKVLDDRIEHLYEKADPAGIVTSAPGLAITLAAGILGRTGDLNRFDTLAGVRAFTGLVPETEQSGYTDKKGGITKHGDPGLRKTLFLAADHARKVDPTIAARYHRLFVDAGKHHNSATCTIAAVLITRIAACWRNGQHYQLRDVDGRLITEAEGREICKTRYRIDPATRAARRNTTKAKRQKQRTGPDKKESQSAPVTSPPHNNATKAA